MTFAILATIDGINFYVYKDETKEEFINKILSAIKDDSSSTKYKTGFITFSCAEIDSDAEIFQKKDLIGRYMSDLMLIELDESDDIVKASLLSYLESEDFKHAYNSIATTPDSKKQLLQNHETEETKSEDSSNIIEITTDGVAESSFSHPSNNQCVRATISLMEVGEDINYADGSRNMRDGRRLVGLLNLELTDKGKALLGATRLNPEEEPKTAIVECIDVSYSMIGAMKGAPTNQTMLKCVKDALLDQWKSYERGQKVAIFTFETKGHFIGLYTKGEDNERFRIDINKLEPLGGTEMCSVGAEISAQRLGEIEGFKQNQHVMRVFG